MPLAFPIKIDDDYACHGTDANGERVHFDDLVFEGQRIGDPVPGDPLNCDPPFGRVVRKPDGLWIVAEEGRELLGEVERLRARLSDALCATCKQRVNAHCRSPFHGPAKTQSSD